MNIGDIVTHKNYNRRLRVIKMDSLVCVVESIDEKDEWVTRLGVWRKPRKVCRISNFIPLPEEPKDQLQLNF
jgi:hypothetical protein